MTTETLKPRPGLLLLILSSIWRFVGPAPVARTLIWYVLREFFAMFALTLMACTLFVLLMLAYRMASDLDTFGATAADLLVLAPYILPRALAESLPPATMICTLMVFGRMNAELEILAAAAGGAALRRYIWPLVVCGLILSGCSLWLLDGGVRWGNSEIRTKALKINKPEFYQSLDRPGRSLTIATDASGSARINLLPHELTADGKLLRPVQIVQFQGGRVVGTVLARDHSFEVGEPGGTNSPERTLAIHLFDYQVYKDRYMAGTSTVLDFTLPDLGLMISIGASRGEKGWGENYAEANRVIEEEHRRWRFMLRRASTFGALTASSSPLEPASPAFAANTWHETRHHNDAVSGTGGARERMRLDFAEFHRKVALALLPFSMIFVGIGLGLLVKKSNRMIGFLIGVAMYALLYYPLTIAAKSISSNISPETSYSWIKPQYLPNLIFLLLGVMLWYLYEHGFTLRIPGFLSGLRSLPGDVLNVCKATVRGVEKVIQLPIRLFFRRTADIYVASTFLAPLIVIVVSIAGFITFIDVVDHMSEILDGIRRAGEPVARNLPLRNEWQAIRDVFVYYGIQTFDYTLDLLPLEILIAGMLCTMQLVRNQEHLILKSSGVRLQRAMAPVILLALCAGVGVSAARELLLPAMMLHRDFLKPQVYHRNSPPTSPALYTVDEKKMPILFEMGQYDSAARMGRELRIYLLGERNNGRVPVVTADVALWNNDKQHWELFTDPAVQVLKALEQSSSGAFGGGKDPKKQKGGEDAPAPVLKEKSDDAKDWIRGGQRWETVGAPATASVEVETDASIPAIAIQKSLRMDWQGPVTPKFIDSDRLGAKVMRLSEVKKLSALKPELMVDWYKRLGEFMMGVLLLWCAIPLMLSDSRSTWMAVLLSIVIGALYMGLCMWSVKYAEKEITRGVVPWLPLVPHAVFLLFGRFWFYRRMET